MDEIRLTGELKTFILNTLGLYEKGVDPSRLNGMWCKSLVQKRICTFDELDNYLRDLANEINDSNKFEYIMAPSESMNHKDIVAIIKDDIFKGKYRIW